MSRRRPRVPGMRSPVWRREIVCGGNPSLALVRALGEAPIRRGELWTVRVGHDDGCAAITGRGMGACTCEIIQLSARRAA